ASRGRLRCEPLRPPASTLEAPRRAVNPAAGVMRCDRVPVPLDPAGFGDHSRCMVAALKWPLALAVLLLRVGTAPAALGGGGHGGSVGGGHMGGSFGGGHFAGGHFGSGHFGGGHFGTFGGPGGGRFAARFPGGHPGSFHGGFRGGFHGGGFHGFHGHGFHDG